MDHVQLLEPAASKVEPATAAYPTGNATFGMAYDADGRPTTETQPGGATVTDSYDSMGDLTGQSGAGASAATAARTFGYDKAGDLTSASTTAAGSQAATSESFGYDDRGLLLSATGTAGSSSMAYNGDGQVASVADTAGTTGYSYDSAGRLATLTDPATGTILSYSYNSMDEVAQISYGTGGDTRSFGYNSLNQLTSDKLATSGGATVASIGYGYDPNGNLTSKTTAGFAGAAANTYSYDEANRLTSWNNGATTTNYSYDAAGNLTKDGSKTYTYDARDELTADGTNTYNYAANGTLASEVTPTGTVTSTTDAYGQQVSSGAESFGNDALGRTVSVAGSAQVSAMLSYAGSSSLVASDGTSAYSWDPSGNLTGVRQGGTGVLAYTDAHTDVVGDFTAKGAALSGSAGYDPWGTVLATSGTVSGRLGFQSQYTDPSSGQVDMGARWYSPAKAGFDNADTVSVDPVPNAAAGNPFAYVGDNPLDGMDPSGHMMITGGGSAPGSLAEQRATHPCNSACESHPPQPVSAAQQRKMLAHDNELRAQAAARERAARARARERAKAHHSCSLWNLHCDLHKVASGFDKARHDVAAGTDAVVRAVSDAADDEYNDVLRPGMALAIRLARDEATAVTDAAEYGIHAAGTAISYAAQAGSRVYHAVTKVAKAAGHAAVHVVKTAYHEAAKAATATVAFVKRHAALITSVVVGVVVFAGCEAVTAGVGTIGCAALAGAASNMASYAVTAAQTGHFSVGGLLMAGATGALIGAASAGLAEGLTSVAGGLLGSGAEAGASSMAESAVGEAASQGSDEAAETAGKDAAEAGEDEPTSCPTTPVGGESFTAKTKVLLADGKAVPISSLKPGEKVLATNTKTGKNKAETITAVMVHDDHDLYDLKVRAEGRTTVIDTTRNHLFWAPDSRRWIKAAALKYGTHLRTPNGGQAVALGGHAPSNPSGWMWDLTVTPSHDFYVQADSTAVLVHNCDFSGGRYGDLESGDGIELHHMPAKSISPLSKDDGPAIQMAKLDHYQTASWGRSAAAGAYRAQQQALIQAGRFDDAMQMDIDDVTSKFPEKYDNAILEMIDSLGSRP